jgi:PEP-CTERM putative exosortase interaction domain
MGKARTTGTLILGLMALSAFFATGSASGRSLPSPAQSMPAASDEIALEKFRQFPLPRSQNALSTAVLYARPASLVAAAAVHLTATKLAISLEDGAVNRYFSDNRGLSMISGSRTNLDLSARLTGPNLQKYVSPVEAFVTTPAGDHSAAAKKFAQFAAPGAIATLVPEPSTWAMTIMGASLLLSVHRFRRKNG